MPASQFTTSFHDEDRSQKVEMALREFGVAVITDVFSADRCNELMNHAVGAIQTISPTIKVDTMSHIRNTWKDRDLMPQTRPGLFQRGYSFLSWDVRTSDDVNTLFKDAYSALRGENVEELVTSLDGINIKPPIPPFHSPDAADWAHLDQTESLNPFECIQGQAVLTNSTAGFRCSPKSHLLHEKILKHYNKAHVKGNWFKFNPTQVNHVQKWVKQSGGEWQIPIIAPQGSIIFWLSSTIHSAKLPDPITLDAVDPVDPWNQWRGVFYVCLRPKVECYGHISTIQSAHHMNRGTNHWGAKMFPTSPYRYVPSDYSKAIQRIVKDPKLIFKQGIDRPEETEKTKALLGI